MLLKLLALACTMVAQVPAQPQRPADTEIVKVPASETVTVRAVPQRSTVHPGDRFAIAVELCVLDGWRIWPNKPTSPPATADLKVFATQIVSDTKAAPLPMTVDFGSIQWPPTREVEVGSVAGAPIKIGAYTEKAVAYVTTTVDAKAPAGESTIRLSLKYQAWTITEALPPSALSVAIPIRIIPLDAPLPADDPADAALFKDYQPTPAAPEIAKFFGVEATGSRFAFVCDISGSMSEQGKLAQLKSELEQSLEGMLDTAQFAIFCFESDAVPLTNRQQWSDANQKHKVPALAKIKELVARGGTNPLPAFAMALALKPRPDALFFMTDGLFDTDVVTQLSAMNRIGKKVPVHCIAFGDRSAEVQMKKIAEESGGTYTYVDPLKRRLTREPR